MTTQHTSFFAFHIHPGTTLATIPANSGVAHLNEQLYQHGLYVPIHPLLTDCTLADAVLFNVGGFRRMRHGTIARYLRAATIQIGDDSDMTLVLGGPTIKRATGYRLHHALLNGLLDRLLATDRSCQPIKLIDITLNLKPLPPARATFLLTFPSFQQAWSWASTYSQQHSSLSALAVASMGEEKILLDTMSTIPSHNPAGVYLLIELEDYPEAIARQTLALETSVAEGSGKVLDRHDQQEQARIDSSSPHWHIWHTLAASWHSSTFPIANNAGSWQATLDLTLPRNKMAEWFSQSEAIADRYHLHLHMWGDIGIGTLHLHLTPQSGVSLKSGEIEQAALLIYHEARQAGGSLSTELGNNLQPVPIATLLGTRFHHGETERENKREEKNGESFPTRSSQSRIVSSEAMAQKLQTYLTDTILLTRPEERACYESDASIATAEDEPLLIALPSTTQDVSTIVRLAAEEGVPIISRGAGSGLAGGATATNGSIILALSRMQQLQIDTAQQVAYVGAGVITADLQQAAESHGLFYPPDPSSQTVSTIGGNIACNAGGPRCLKYGVTSDYILALTGVLADGSIIHAGDGLVAQSPDTGLLNLLIGNEGTLLVVTEATLRLVAQPASRRTTLAIYNHLDDACATVEAIMAAGIVPAALELMDDTTIQCVEDYMHLGLPHDAGALLLMQADGSPEAVAMEADTLAKLARQGGAREVKQATSSHDEVTLWKARRSIGPSLARVALNKLGEDISVPVSQVVAAVRRIKEIAEQYQLAIPVFGHAGDGNLHPNILFNKRNPEQVQRVWQAAEAIFAATLELGGTLSGEHGIGTLKRPFMTAALGADGIALHWQIKHLFDPQGLLNPGKVIPDKHK